MSPGERFIAECVAQATRKVVQPNVRDHATCVLSTRIAIEVLDYFEIKARPQPVHLAALNEPMARWLEQGQPGGQEQAVEMGAWVVETHPAAPGDGWNGHLVAIVQDEALLDPDLGAFSRPHKQIDLPDGFLGSIDANPPWAYVIQGATVLYTPTDDDIWKGSGDWSKGDIKKFAGPMIRSVKRAVANL